MITETLMTVEEHKEVFQAISESIVADPPEVDLRREAPGRAKREVDERALRGALHLDEHHPGWADKIDLEWFNIQDSTSCVVGQAFGYYNDWHVKMAFGVSGWGSEANKFGILPVNNEDDTEVLQRSWEILIKERQREVVNS